MNVKLHAQLQQAYAIIWLVMPIFGCVGISMWQASVEVRPFLAAVGITFLASHLVWWFFPVECLRYDCPGRMRRTEQRVSFWTVSATYQCDQCEEQAQVDVFSPNIQWSFGDY